MGETPGVESWGPDLETAVRILRERLGAKYIAPRARPGRTTEDQADGDRRETDGGPTGQAGPDDRDGE